MKKNLLLALLVVFSVNAFAQSSNKRLAFDKSSETFNYKLSEGDTIFWHDHNVSYIFANEDDAENFSWNREDYDEGVPAPYDGETDADLLELVTNFYWNYESDTMGNTITPNGVNTFDFDENPDPSVPDTNWYVTAYSWFTNVNLRADNWLGFGPITIPDEGAEFRFLNRSVSQWRDGFDVYVTTSGMEAYNDVDPGVTPVAYSLSELYPCTEEDTEWSEHTVSLNEFAGESVYITFHHASLDKERIMLDEFVVVETDNMNINESLLNGIKVSPNPSNGIFTITSNTSDIKTIEVVNILGEVIDSRVVEGTINETFDMTTFSAGMYFVKSSNGTTESTQRIIIK